ncbi:two-component sensor kinase [Arcobacter sp. L]|nr:two-component sensor kinase [Arcobacter sp. L]
MIENLNRDNASIQEINEKISIFNMKLSNITFEELVNSNAKRVKIDDEAPIDVYILNNVKFVHFNPKFPDFKKMPPPPKPLYERFEEPIFFKLRPQPPGILIIDELNETSFKYFWLMILLIIDALLIWFYMFTREKLKPLISLKEDMKNLSKGELKISTNIEGKDEISQVAKEFSIALKQLKELRNSRNLFLRNIMHELKTPITKGKLITDIYEDSERKFILIRVFQRLEYLLSEFAKIEELTSGKITLNKNKYHIIELINQALDILLVEEHTIEIEDNANLEINADFELFSIELKNLIDNAIKYGYDENPRIIIEKDYIEIINKGEKLTKNIEEYYKPFNHDYETATTGLGLGLYISNNIVKIHNYYLEYDYKDGYHHFHIKII